MIAGFATEQGNRLGFRLAVRDSVVSTRLAVIERSVFIELPEDAFGALMGGTADLADEFLGSGVADGSGEPIHAGLAVELLP